MSVAELLAEDDSIGPPKHGQRWGNWTYNGPNLTHQHPHYEIDLARCLDDATTFGWILHVAEKRWCTPEDIGNLVKALARTIGHRLR